jgi:hypothetical protein
MLLAHFEPLVRAARPYLLATDLVMDALDHAPFGVRIPEAHRLNPQHQRNADFLHLIKRLDELTFGPVGMPMPKWVFYDCAVMPGAVFGLARPAQELDRWVRDAMGVPADYEGPVPLSLFIAIPLLDEGAWLLYTLCDVNSIAPGAAPAGLSELTLVLGLKCFGVRHLLGTTQWRSPKLQVVSTLGPLEVVTALTPAHSYERTLTFRTRINDENLAAVLAESTFHPATPLATHVLDLDNEALLAKVQADVERGVRWLIVGPPRRVGAYTQISMRRESTEGEPQWS